MGKHDAVAGAEDGIRINLVGRAEAGAEVLVPVVYGRITVTGVGTAAGKLQRAGYASDRVDEGRVEEAAGIVNFTQRGEIIPTQANVKGEVLVDLPVVLSVGRDGAKTGAELLLEVSGEAGFIDLAYKEAGVGGAAVGYRSKAIG